jgi:hypothetical protein
VVKEKSQIIVSLKEENFDKACSLARSQTLSLFGIDESGHSTKNQKFSRTNNSILIIFEKVHIELFMTGTEIKYFFTAQIN